MIFDDARILTMTMMNNNIWYADALLMMSRPRWVWFLMIASSMPLYALNTSDVWPYLIIDTNGRHWYIYTKLDDLIYFADTTNKLVYYAHAKSDIAAWLMIWGPADYRRLIEGAPLTDDGALCRDITNLGHLTLIDNSAFRLFLFIDRWLQACYCAEMHFTPDIADFRQHFGHFLLAIACLLIESDLVKMGIEMRRTGRQIFDTSRWTQTALAFSRRQDVNSWYRDAASW